jgi:uncharacterized protein YggU (UPF0235/DUF167 family)
MRPWRETPDGVELTVRVTARGGAARIEGVVDGALRLRVAAPPVDGAANEAVARLLAAELGLPRGAVTLVAGARARVKRFRLVGRDLPARLDAVAAAGPTRE